MKNVSEKLLVRMLMTFTFTAALATRYSYIHSSVVSKLVSPEYYCALSQWDFTWFSSFDV